jgi:hypothetical protein
VPTNPNLRDRLCDLEPQNPLLRERYKKELQAMLEKKLGPWSRLFLAIVMAASVAIAIFLGIVAIIHDELPLLARGALAGGVVFSLAWAGLIGWTLRRGSMQLRIQPASMAVLCWVFAVMLETCFLVLAPGFPDHFHALLALFCGLVILIGAGVQLINTCIQQAALRIGESLLRLEYRLAQLEEDKPEKS